MLISVLLTFVWHLWQCHHSYAFFAVNTDLQRRRESDHSYEIGFEVGRHRIEKIHVEESVARCRVDSEIPDPE